MSERPAELFGGNRVRRFGKLPGDALTLADDAYRYEIHTVSPGEQLSIEGLRTGVVWVVRGVVRCSHLAGQAEASAEHAVLFDGKGLAIEGVEEAAVFLAGTREPAGESASLTVRSIAELHRVEKPWGEELWINGRHPTFAFKRIRLNAGQRTSLQYHDFKRETNLLVSGQARLHYNEIAGAHDGPYLAEEIMSDSVVDVTPGVLHRIEAVTDLELFEVSTPHLDDVIRVSDDTNRADGLIQSEHTGAQGS